MADSQSPNEPGLLGLQERHRRGEVISCSQVHKQLLMRKGRGVFSTSGWTGEILCVSCSHCFRQATPESNFASYFCSHFLTFNNLCSQSTEKFGSIFLQPSPQYPPGQHSKERKVLASTPRSSQTFSGLTGQGSLTKLLFFPTPAAPQLPPPHFLSPSSSP